VFALGLVAKNFLDLLHDIVRQFGQELNGTAVVHDLLWFCGAENYGRNVLVLAAPCESQLSRCAAQLLGDLRQLLDLLDLGLALLALQAFNLRLEKVFVVGEAAVLGNALVVFTSEHTAVQRRPDRCTILELLQAGNTELAPVSHILRTKMTYLVEGLVFLLETFTVECVVLGLFGDGSDETTRSVDSRSECILTFLTCTSQQCRKPLGSDPQTILTCPNSRPGSNHGWFE
jgi:hypothetical protein